MKTKKQTDEMILVTGATGFLGAELIYQLTGQGVPVRAIKRIGSVVPFLLQENPLIEWVIADINDLSAMEDAMEGIWQVYHCAAIVSFNPADKMKLLRVNIEGTSNVVNLCAELGIRLLHVSSVAALGLAKKGLPITENDYWEYDSGAHTYAISKYEGEMEVWRGIAEGLDALIVNPSVIIGAAAGYKGSGALFKMVKNGLAYYTSGSTGFVDVTDVATSMIVLMNSENSGERYTISAENISYKDLFTEIAQGFGLKAPAKEAQPWKLGLAWRMAKVASLFTGRPSSLTKATVKSSLTTSTYSNEKIKQTTGIEFKPLKRTIKEVCTALSNT